MGNVHTLYLFAASMCLRSASASQPWTIRDGFVTSIQSPSGKIQYLAPKQRLGEVHGRARRAGQSWQTFSLNDSSLVDASSRFLTVGGRLKWTIELSNRTSEPVEVGDLSIPLPMNGRFDKPGDINQSVLKHSFISGAGSFIFWSPSNRKEPRLCLTTGANTSLEYWSAVGKSYEVFLYSKAIQADLAAKGSRWRIPATSLVLKPRQIVTRTSSLDWAESDQGVRDLLAAKGKLDVHVVPGMTVPTDLVARFAVRGPVHAPRVSAEYPRQTEVRSLGRKNGYFQYEIAFRRLGENRLTLTDATGGKTYLEFFSCEPVETLIQKRAAFLAKCQHVDPTKWYRGLISEWNMESQTLLGPDNYDRIKGWRIYEVTCDDPGLGKPSFLAAKNAEFPVQREVDALDDYIQYFVWGGLQQTTKEPYPYGIYGIPDWKTLRERKTGKPTDGVEHLWRCYDYPHIILLYWSMYRVAAAHPEIHTRFDASTYLDRAFGTAQAMFTIPDKLVKWSPYETGYYNELVIPRLIQDLDRCGRKSQAEILRSLWEAKVKHFVLGSPDLFGSEYAFDSTGFESTHALADYALAHGKELGISKTQGQQFMTAQTEANLFCRGTVEPAYYYLGSDYRGGAGNGYTLSYMSQMGGGSLLDFGLHHAGADAPFYLRLGSASLLSSWALMNTGTKHSNSGYWYPGANNDGGAGGGFEPAAMGETWLGQPHHRGSWYYGCEIDLGFSGYLRNASTILTDDPIFGRFALGGEVTPTGVIPRDGLRRRFYVRIKGVRLDATLENARFVANIPIRVEKGAIHFEVQADSTLGGQLTVDGVGGTKTVQVKGRATIRVPITPR